MTTVALRLLEVPPLRVDLRGLDVAKLASAPAADVARMTVAHGNETLELGAMFDVRIEASDTATPELRLEGDLRRFDRIGWQLASGRVVVDGGAGDYCGAAMSGGDLVVHGDAGECAGCGMSGGRLRVRGTVGDFAGAAFAGDMEGMRGGSLVVEGSAGARFGDRMRRGVAVVTGDVGPFAGSRMVAGTIAIGSGIGAHLGFGMRRGSIVCAAAPGGLDGTFLRVAAEAGVIWQLIARDLQALGGPFAGLARRGAVRHVGDVAVSGTGEVLVAR